MTLRNITKVILIVVAVGLIAYDIVPFCNPERGDTISEVIAYYSMRSFALALTFGVLAGHFFLTRDNGSQYPKILITIGILAIVLDVVTHTYDISMLLMVQQHPIVSFIIGLPIGSYLWSQSKEDKL